MRKERKKIRLNLNRLRQTLIFSFAVIICFSLGFRAIAASFTEVKQNPAYVEIIVKNGESLWQLTKAHYKGNSDIRKVIYKVKKINNLESAEIQPGQIIRIPQI